MHVTTEHAHDVAILRVADARLLYPNLGGFTEAALHAIESGARGLIIDQTPVTYIDSATIGCFMDVYRHAAAAGRQVRLAGVQPRVQTMLSLTGTQRLMPMHDDLDSAVAALGAQ